MGLLENFAQHATFKSVALVIFGAWFLQYVVGRIHEHIKIKRLGHYGFQIPSRAPFGTYKSRAFSHKSYSNTPQALILSPKPSSQL